jgi:hypothetical protein
VLIRRLAGLLKWSFVELSISAIRQFNKISQQQFSTVAITMLAVSCSWAVCLCLPLDYPAAAMSFALVRHLLAI